MKKVHSAVFEDEDNGGFAKTTATHKSAQIKQKGNDKNREAIKAGRKLKDRPIQISGRSI